METKTYFWVYAFHVHAAVSFVEFDNLLSSGPGVFGSQYKILLSTKAMQKEILSRSEVAYTSR